MILSYKTSKVETKKQIQNMTWHSAEKVTNKVGIIQIRLII